MKHIVFSILIFRVVSCRTNILKFKKIVKMCYSSKVMKLGKIVPIEGTLPQKIN
jgi:hypothetical protein